MATHKLYTGDLSGCLHPKSSPKSHMFPAMNQINPKASTIFLVMIIMLCSWGRASSQGFKAWFARISEEYRNILNADMAAQYFQLVVWSLSHILGSFQCMDSTMIAAIIWGVFTVNIAQTVALAVDNSFRRAFITVGFLFLFWFWFCGICCNVR